MHVHAAASPRQKHAADAIYTCRRTYSRLCDTTSAQLPWGPETGVSNKQHVCLDIAAGCVTRLTKEQYTKTPLPCSCEFLSIINCSWLKNNVAETEHKAAKMVHKLRPRLSHSVAESTMHNLGRAVLTARLVAQLKPCACSKNIWCWIVINPQLPECGLLMFCLIPLAALTY